jgi:5'-3' exonuclease
MAKPSKKIMIAFDGVVPLAKMKQQRERRFKSTFQSNITNIINNNSTSLPIKDNVEWSTLMITPGTKFMNELDNRITTYFSNPKKYNVSDIEVSGSDKVGEGEHKLFHSIRKSCEQGFTNDNLIVYGLDADLIMLSLNHLQFNKNIFLFRDTPDFITSINKSLNTEHTYYMDINQLGKSITSLMDKKHNINRISDYIFICFMLGNDFMPHFPAVNIRTGGIDKLINAYLHTIGNTTKTIIKNKRIQWRVYSIFISSLQLNENEYLITETNKRIKLERRHFPSNTVNDKLNKFINIPSLDVSVEKYINPEQSDWEQRYYHKLFDIYNMTNDIRKKICDNYMEGLEWCFYYYCGDCIHWGWKYNYSYPPLLKDLVTHIPINNNTNFIDIKNDSAPVDSLVLLSYVLPREGLYILDEKIHNYLITILNDKYPENNNCVIKWTYCKYFWESHIMLPEIKIKSIKNIINMVNK